MDLALLGARLILAAVFVVAAVGKLLDLPGSRRAVSDFGVPVRLASVAGIALPVVELAVAVALLPLATAWWGAIAALVLLLVFVTAIGASLARGRTPDCHCFGRIHSALAGRATIGRNAALATLAGFVVVAGWDSTGTSAFAWLGNLSGSGFAVLAGSLVAATVLGAMAWVVAHLVGQNGRMLVRLDVLEQIVAAGDPAGMVVLMGSGGPAGRARAAGDPSGDRPPGPTTATAASAATASASAPGRGDGLGLPPGTVAPAFALPDLDGRVVSLGDLRADDRPVLLLFADPNCSPCNQVMREVSRWQRGFAHRLRIAVLSRGSSEVNRAKAREYDLETVLIQPDSRVAEAYRALGTPSAVVIRADGTIGAPTAGGYDAVRALVARLAGTPAPVAAAPVAAAPVTAAMAQVSVPVRAPVGSANQAPWFWLPDLAGRAVTLADLTGAGRPVVLYFTDPMCDPCAALLPELERLQREFADRVTVAIISRGTAEANRERLGTEAGGLVLLQSDMELIRAYGITQAPAAVLVRPDGTVDGDPAYGEGMARTLFARVTGESSFLPPARVVSAIATGPVVTQGDAVPSITVTSIDGTPFDLAGICGTETILLFWSPSCGYCVRMLAALQAWERARTVALARLVIVSAGTLAATQAHELHSTVVLDDGAGVGRRFGTRGTPAAVRIDREGRVASPVAAGVTAVMALLRGDGDAGDGAPSGDAPAICDPALSVLR